MEIGHKPKEIIKAALLLADKMLEAARAVENANTSNLPSRILKLSLAADEYEDHVVAISLRMHMIKDKPISSPEISKYIDKLSESSKRVQVTLMGRCKESKK